MNAEEKEVLQRLHLTVVEDLDVKEILPHLFQNKMITFEEYEEFEQLNEARATKCRKLLRTIMRPGSNCTFDGFLQALRYNDVYSFLADQLEQTFAETRNKSVYRQESKNEVIYEPVRKINVFTKRRRAISALSHKLKRLSHDGDIGKFQKLVTAIDTKFKENKLNMFKNVTDRMQLADMRFASLEAGISAKRVQYDKTVSGGDMFRHMESVIPFTSNPRVSSMSYLARYGSAIAMKDSVDDGLAYVQFAKEHAEHVSPCKESGMVYYIEVNLLSQKYEADPSDHLKTNILKTSEQGIAQFIDENEEVKNDYQRMLLIKMIFCYLGVGLFCKKIEKSKTSKADIEEAKKIIDFVETSNIWRGMEKRRKMLFYVAKSEFYKQQGNLDLAMVHAKEARKLGHENHWSAEVVNITQMVDELERVGRSACTNSDISEDDILAELFGDMPDLEEESALDNYEICSKSAGDDNTPLETTTKEMNKVEPHMFDLKEVMIHQDVSQTCKCKDDSNHKMNHKVISLQEVQETDDKQMVNFSHRNSIISEQQSLDDHYLMELKDVNSEASAEPSHNLMLLKEGLDMNGSTESLKMSILTTKEKIDN
ncbi:uncharacterized protein LOC132750459 [Ruditapes philippinarum]|uniref:uncharacterized protein LOC132750459 n=1 Tax=Ruditapes philippinarum TaxID=129788 RepID=UPI00295BDBA8|nr:uncharacterized protein LOC132750459 [Ruditapes philippinarum]